MGRTLSFLLQLCTQFPYLPTHFIPNLLKRCYCYQYV